MSSEVNKLNLRPSVYDLFLQFRAVIIQAIAKSWVDEKYNELLIKDPAKALKEGFDYDCPFDLDMKSEPNNAAWNKTVEGDWLVYKQNELCMVLPPKPKDKNEELAALSNYNTKHLTFLE